MAGTMSLEDLVADLKRSLHDTAAVFDAALDADFERFLRQALPDMRWKRPITKLGSVTLEAGVESYLIYVSDFAALKTDLWRNLANLPKPWMPGYPGALPRITAVRESRPEINDWDDYFAEWGSGRWRLVFDPAPTSAQLACLGSVCKFWYFADHSINTAEVLTTVSLQDRGLLLLRAQAEAMLELSLRNVAKPVQLRDGLSGTPRNSTPRALFDALLSAFLEAR